MNQLQHRRSHGAYDWFGDDLPELHEQPDHTWDIRPVDRPMEVFRLPTRRDASLLRSQEEVERLFEQYAAEWREASAASSLAAPTFMHPAYQRIIGLGPQAVPLIIDELRIRIDHWFWALVAVVGRDVAADASSLRDAAQAWITWYDGDRA